MASQLLILLWFLTAPAHADCDDFERHVDWSFEDILQINPSEARGSLDAAEKSLNCGKPVTPDAIARFFLADAAILVLNGESEAAAESFHAAYRADRTTWVESLGPGLRTHYDRAKRELHPLATLAVKAGPGWSFWLNGDPQSGPAEVYSGIQIVQVSDRDRVVYGRVIRVEAGQDETLLPNLPETPPRDAPWGVEGSTLKLKPAPAHTEPKQPDSTAPSVQDTAVKLQFTLDGSVGVALGQALQAQQSDGDDLVEPNLKVSLPLQTGVRLRSGKGWLHPRVGLAPLLGGQYLFATSEGPDGTPFAILMSAASGVQLGTIDLGGLVGIADPGRIVTRAVTVIPIGQTPFNSELRAGFNIGTAGRLEPAASLTLGVSVF